MVLLSIGQDLSGGPYPDTTYSSATLVISAYS